MVAGSQSAHSGALKWLPISHCHLNFLTIILGGSVVTALACGGGVQLEPRAAACVMNFHVIHDLHGSWCFNPLAGFPSVVGVASHTEIHTWEAATRFSHVAYAMNLVCYIPWVMHVLVHMCIPLNIP